MKSFESCFPMFIRHFPLAAFNIFCLSPLSNYVLHLPHTRGDFPVGVAVSDLEAMCFILAFSSFREVPTVAAPQTKSLFYTSLNFTH